MTDDEQSVHSWLDSLARDYPHWVELCRAMLARPAMPEDPTPEMVLAMRDAVIRAPIDCEGKAPVVAAVYHAIYAHLTKPAVKTVWDVAYDNGCVGGCDAYDDPADAIKSAEGHTKYRRAVTITPREVPA